MANHVHLAARLRYRPIVTLMHWRPVSVGIGGVLLLAAGAAACSAIFGFETLQDGTADSSSPVPPPRPPAELVDGSADAGCVLARPPTMLAQNPKLTHFALQGIRFLPPDERAAAPGLDLDCADTRAPIESTAKCALPPGYNPVNFVDYEGGVDNMAAKGLTLATNQAIIRSIDERVRAGEVGMAFTLRADLDQGGGGASMGAFPSRGIQGTASCSKREAGAPVPAQDAGRDGSFADVWCNDSKFYDDAPPTEYGPTALRSSEAWVDGGILFARFPRLAIPLLDVEASDGAQPTDPVLYLTITDAWLRARIVGETNGHRLVDGVIGGRWPLLDAVNFLAAAAEQTCQPDTVAFQNVTQNLCRLRDMTASSSLPATAPCEAFSIGMAFEAYEVKEVGTFGPVLSKAGDCPDDLRVCGDGGP